MATPLLLPKQGNTVETCLIIAWKKNVGDDVKKGEIVCEVETDKAIFELESPADGIFLDKFFEEGDDVPVLTNIAVVGDKGENYDKYIPVAGRKAPVKKEAEKAVQETSSDKPGAPSNGEAPRAVSSEAPVDSRMRISPRAKRIAQELKVSTKGLKGSGPGNRILARDVLAASKNLELPLPGASGLVVEKNFHPVTDTRIRDEVTTSDMNRNTIQESRLARKEEIKIVPLKGIRKLIADRMLESLRTSAQLTLNSSADASALLNLRKRFKNGTVFKEFQSVTINDMIHYAVVKTLPAHPELNTLLVGDQIEYHNKIHLGFAVDTSRGLIVPVIRNAEELNLLQLSVEAKRLAAAAQSGKVDTDDLTGGTFTVTNLGVLGIESFTPVLNLPQTAILGVNAIALRPVGNENGTVNIPYISFSLTVDHRVIDGAVGARFLQSLAKTVAEIDLAVASDAIKR